jgi:hypothetical protein
LRARWLYPAVVGEVQQLEQQEPVRMTLMKAKVR